MLWLVRKGISMEIFDMFFFAGESSSQQMLFWLLWGCLPNGMLSAFATPSAHLICLGTPRHFVLWPIIEAWGVSGKQWWSRHGKMFGHHGLCDLQRCGRDECKKPRRHRWEGMVGRPEVTSWVACHLLARLGSDHRFYCRHQYADVLDCYCKIVSI